ncbi:CatB-related O-acetyltransferase [Flavobacterium sp. TAB 87]|uniref:CatB-related O-acetyltransferase n=1 Tax=Flavobacterium sp. TAB 87 TaxID=1729581 RepID=UPI0026F4727E|nr:CatB-related O-acetyltransferase [Flavobacterium sp. TAB 87]
MKDKISLNELYNVQAESSISKKAKFLGSHKVSKVVIDDYTYISNNAQISMTIIGKYCSIGPNFLCGWGIHPITGISTSPMFYSTSKQNGFSVATSDKIEERKEIIIGNDVFIGSNVIILDGVKIGNGAVIGAGAVVSKDIPPYAVAVGNPITVIKYRFDEKTIQALLKIEWWNKSEEMHLEIEKYFFDIDKFISIHNKK